MVEFLTSLVVLCPIVNRVVEFFKTWLSSQTNISAETRGLLVFGAQIVVSLVVFVGTYAATPLATGTLLDKYPVVVIALSTGLLALGSDAIYQVLEVVKALKGIGGSDNAPRG